MSYPQITSKDNPKIKETACLLRERSERRRQGRFICEGAVMLREAIESKIKIIDIFVSETAYLKERETLESTGAPVIKVSESVLSRLSDTSTPQGIVFTAALPFNEGFTYKEGSVLILDGVSDPGNMGTILRTAEAFGINDILLCGSCADVFSPKVVRASMGSVFRVRTKVMEAQEAADAAHTAGLTLYAAALSGNTVKPSEMVSPCAVVIGSEAAGISDEMLSLCENHVKIPMVGRTESLNAALAAGIIMYELTKFI